MSLRISLSRGYTAEVLNRGLDAAVIEAKNHWRKREQGIGGGEGLIMIEKYTQLDNALGLHLRYLQVLQGSPMLTDMELEPWTGKF